MYKIILIGKNADSIVRMASRQGMNMLQDQELLVNIVHYDIKYRDRLQKMLDHQVIAEECNTFISNKGVLDYYRNLLNAGIQPKLIEEKLEGRYTHVFSLEDVDQRVFSFYGRFGYTPITLRDSLVLDVLLEIAGKTKKEIMPRRQLWGNL